MTATAYILGKRETLGGVPHEFGREFRWLVLPDGKSVYESRLVVTRIERMRPAERHVGAWERVTA